MTDHIDRTHQLSTDAFGWCNPDRIHVIRGLLPLPDDAVPWQVWRGGDLLSAFATHAEAIRWAQGRAVPDRHPDAARYRPDSPRKQGQDGRTGAALGPNYTHVISGPQNGSNEFDTFPEPMEAP